NPPPSPRAESAPPQLSLSFRGHAMPEIYHYRCSQCDKLHDSAIKMSRGSPDRKCTKTFNCAGTYGYKDMVVDHNPYKNAHFAADKVKKQAVVSAFRGRSVSA